MSPLLTPPLSEAQIQRIAFAALGQRLLTVEFADCGEVTALIVRTTTSTLRIEAPTREIQQEKILRRRCEAVAKQLQRG